MSMTNGDLVRLRDGLRDVGLLEGAKFAYAVARNFRIVNALCKDLQACLEHDDAYKAFENGRVELIRDGALKDERGRPRMEDNGECLMADYAETTLKMQALEKEHADAIEAQAKKQEAYEALLLEPAEDVKLYTIPFELAPEKITGAQVDAIFEIFEEEAD